MARIFELNIGLDNNPLLDSSPDITADNIAAALRNVSILVYEHRIEPRGQHEPTYIARVAPPRGGWHKMRAAVFAACLLTRQEAIAVFDPVKGEGALIGPRADRWGEFNLDFFQRF